MSIDYDLVCLSCKKSVHLGQRFAAGYGTFGYGTNDVEGMEITWRFLLEHDHANLTNLRVMVSDDVPEEITRVDR